MDDKFKKHLEEAVTTHNIDKNMAATHELVLRVVKMLRKGSMLEKQILTIDPGFASDLKNLRKIADDLDGVMEDVFAEVQMANRDGQ